MADTEDDVGSVAAASRAAVVRIAQDPQVIFADLVSTHTVGMGISKFFLARIDPDPEGVARNKIEPVAQIVMPMSGFVQMWAFFEHRLKIMKKENIISQSEIDNARATMQRLSGASSEPL
jgi:hypothetical protein